MQANVSVKAVQSLTKTTQKAQKIQFKIMTGSKVSQEKVNMQNMAKWSQHISSDEDEPGMKMNESAAQEVRAMQTTIFTLETTPDLSHLAVPIPATFIVPKFWNCCRSISGLFPKFGFISFI